MLASMVKEYFWTAREREKIRIAREAGKPAPWTSDPILSSFRFTNVRREDDRVTRWFRENLRDPLKSSTNVMLATVAFRTFNLITTGEKLKPMLLEGKWSSKRAMELLADQRPIVTGAYIVRTPWGMTKLPGACAIVDNFCEYHAAEELLMSRTLEWAHSRLTQVSYFGGFTAYEIISDLRWTNILNHADDIMTWANPGPGCLCGMSYVAGREMRPNNRDRIETIAMMRELLARSKSKSNWPSEWPAWEMREVEHWLCEFSKYQHAKEGKRLKRRFP